MAVNGKQWQQQCNGFFRIGLLLKSRDSSLLVPAFYLFDILFIIDHGPLKPVLQCSLEFMVQLYHEVKTL